MLCLRIQIDQQRGGENKVMLVADSPGEYGIDIGRNITELMNRLFDLNSDLQIVLHNFHPRFFLQYLDYFLEKISLGKIYHVNLPIQSACTRILSKMKRRYTREDLVKIFDGLRQIKFNMYDTHILVGFDGENDADFEQTVSFIREYKPRYVLASKYMYATYEKDIKRFEVVSDHDKEKRVLYLASCVRDYGGIINYDGSPLSVDRWNRLNKPKEMDT